MTAYGIALTMVIVGAFGLGWHFGRAALTRRLDRLYRDRIARPRREEVYLQDTSWPTVKVGRPLYDQEQER